VKLTHLARRTKQNGDASRAAVLFALRSRKKQSPFSDLIRFSQQDVFQVIEARPAVPSLQIEAIEVHHLRPRLHKVIDKLLFAIGFSIELRHGA
jgi:hypothetical protein